MKHIVRFIREPDTGMLRGVCLCGASHADRDRSIVEKWALNSKAHEKFPVREPPLKIEGFVSGLPDDSFGR